MDSSRITGIVTIATGIAAIALLLGHPGGEAAPDFATVLKHEAANQAVSAVVHGGYVVVLAIQLCCFALFAGGWRTPLATAGLVLFAVGAGMLMASLVTDGLIIPQLAARYAVAPPDRMPVARGLILLCGTAIQFLMPMGLFFQGAGVVAWGAVLAKAARGFGLAGLAAGVLVAATAIGGFATGHAHLLMIAIVLLAAWAGIAGMALMRQP